MDKVDFRFAAKFAALFGLLLLLLFAARDTQADRFLLEVLALRPSAWVIAFVAGDLVQVSGTSLISSYVRLNVLAGCDGRDALLLLLAAVGAAQASWRWKLVGVVLGALLVCALNYSRITALYFALRLNRHTFDLLHGYLLPALIVFSLALFFMWWLRAQPKSAAGLV